MWIVQFQGASLDIDPLDFDMALMGQIEQRAGIAGLNEFSQALARLDATAWRALYWAAMIKGVRHPGPFGDFAGPTMRQVLNEMKPLVEMLETIGEALGVADPKAQPEAPAIDGLLSSELSTDGAAPSSSTDLVSSTSSDTDSA